MPRAAIEIFKNESPRDRRLAIAGSGQVVWSWVHAEDAAAVTVAALDFTPGVYNIVDGDPRQSCAFGFRAFAAFVGAPEPPRVSEVDTLQTAGLDWIYYSTRLRGASNAKAKRELRFAPRKLEWLVNQIFP